MNIAVGSDHAGYELRRAVRDHLLASDHTVIDCGASGPERYDYPLASDEVAAAVLQSRAEFGVLVCGSGVGVCIRANRHTGVRAAQCLTEEMARLARSHNHANIVCLGARLQDEESALRIVDVFLATSADQDPRHQHRVSLIDAPLQP